MGKHEKHDEPLAEWERELLNSPCSWFVGDGVGGAIRCDEIGPHSTHTFHDVFKSGQPTYRLRVSDRLDAAAEVTLTADTTAFLESLNQARRDMDKAQAVARAFIAGIRVGEART